MALDTSIAPYEAPEKDLYEMGEIPPMGYVPKQMYAWAIRKERHGEPDKAMLQEVVDVPTLDSNDVLVLVMAAGVNYNGVWAALGTPMSVFDVHKADYAIVGSDAAGIVWAVGDKVKRWKVGDEVVVHCNQDDGDDEHCNGGDPMYSPTQRIWGYETPGWVVQPIHPCSKPAIDAAPQASDLGRKCVLHADACHCVPHVVRP